MKVIILSICTILTALIGATTPIGVERIEFSFTAPGQIDEEGLADLTTESAALPEEELVLLCQNLMEKALTTWGHKYAAKIKCVLQARDFVNNDGSYLLAFAQTTRNAECTITVLPVFWSYSDVGRQNVAIHEVGHCLLVSHNNDPSSIMFAYIRNDAVQKITPLDKKMYEIKWGSNLLTSAMLVR